MIEFDHVHMRFGEKRVLSDFSFRFVDGQRYAVLAPSGGGKTTLLRLASGLLAPSSGRVRRNPDITSVCFQEDRLLPWYTARENIALALSPGRFRADILAKADEWLERIGLFAERNALGATLSGGMKRRVALARALAFDAPALLLDEPFRALDEHAHAAMRALVLEQSAGKLLLLVTHDERDAAGMQLVRL